MRLMRPFFRSRIAILLGITAPLFMPSLLNAQQLAKRLIGPLGMHLDLANPIVNARLDDGSRLNVVIPPAALPTTPPQTGWDPVNAWNGRGPCPSVSSPGCWGPTWVTLLLPYIEQDPLYRAWDMSLPSQHPNQQPLLHEDIADDLSYLGGSPPQWRERLLRVRHEDVPAYLDATERLVQYVDNWMVK